MHAQPMATNRNTENNLDCLEKGGQRTERLLFVCYTPDVTGFFISSFFIFIWSLDKPKALYKQGNSSTNKLHQCLYYQLCQKVHSKTDLTVMWEPQDCGT